MDRFHYEYIQPKYGPKAKLSISDPDSRMSQIVTDKAYQEMFNDRERFDLASYPRSREFYDPSRNKVYFILFHPFCVETLLFHFLLMSFILILWFLLLVRHWKVQGQGNRGDDHRAGLSAPQDIFFSNAEGRSHGPVCCRVAALQRDPPCAAEEAHARRLHGATASPTEKLKINRRIGSQLDQLYTSESKKRRLCGFDDMRFRLEDGVKSLVF